VVTDGGDSIGCAWGDYDNDGDLDLFVANSGNNFLYANNGNSRSWLNIKCIGIASSVSAVGTKVKVLATINGSPVWQLREISGGTLSQDSLNAEFGLGNATIVDEIRIEWPSGIVQPLTNVAVNQFLTVTEAETYEFLSKWGSSGTGDGQFDHPFGIAVDNSGNVYVADTHNYRIQKFTASGDFVGKWGSWGSDNGQFNQPYGVAVDSSGYVYVADTLNNRVQKFTSDGTFVAKWGTSGNGDGQFNAPQGIAVSSSGYVYVVDTTNYRVQKFTSSGDFVGKWGSNGMGDGQFRDPWGIAINSVGDVYVTETSGHRVQKFTSSAAFLGWWGLDNLGFTGWHSPGSGKWGIYGFGDGQFGSPGGTAVDSTGDVYVADYGNSRVQKFTSSGAFVAKWGGLGSGNGQLNYPAGIAVDSAGYAYVADTNNFRIQKFRKK
jgi:hypothetical protein